MISFAYTYRKDIRDLMKKNNIINKLFSKTCAYFSVMTALYALISWMINVDDGLVLVDASKILFFSVASVLFAAGSIILASELMNPPLRVFVHYLIYVFAFLTCFILPANSDASTGIVMAALFSIVYAIVLTIILVIRSRYKKRAEKTKDYKRQFRK